mmetsp:Transcript_14945/g.23414  ORF Transcript_14945/g.23414 Transcript_14945/m.23414 type:complete len:138 (+) Transcript_14945:780-1193(+)
MTKEVAIARKMKKYAIPDLEVVFPDDLTVEEQAKLFSECSFVFSAHGAALTNVIFTDWKAVTVVEVTVTDHPVHLRDHFQIENYYVLSCKHMQGQRRDPWTRDLDCNNQELTATVQMILIAILNTEMKENRNLEYER